MSAEEMDSSRLKLHIDMWKHYDGLRQGKNGAFLTTNSILVAIAGILFQESRASTLIALVSLLGILVCISWALLLARNAAYIDFHRERAGAGNKAFWTPRTRTPRSKYLDCVPVSTFCLFWVVILVLRA
jgi:hypothetical protein